jgi:tRNA-dihydrouridine synthase B
MDGFSDQPFRSICRELGSAISYTEFINTTDVIRNIPYILKRIAFLETERPVCFQIYGNSTDEIIKAAEILEEYSPDFFDLNLGCSEKHVASRGAGSGLLRYPKKIGEIISALVTRFKIPITAKIRLGWNKDSLNYIEVAKILEDNGASMIAVHGRTRDQRWREPAIWLPIEEVKKAVSIPVVGNGDIKTLEDIDKMFTSTGCDGIMIGRAAIGNPWLFSRVRKAELSQKEIFEMIDIHWQSIESFYGREKAMVVFRKHLKSYLSSSQFVELDLKNLISAVNPIEVLKTEFNLG